MAPNQRRLELVAVATTIVAILAFTVVPFLYERASIDAHAGPAEQVITLTGVAKTGTWTAEAVHGGNYWYRSFSMAQPVLTVGEPVLFRFKSVDVVHTFYSPELGIGPIEVYPGHVAEVMVTPEREGAFAYYCTTMCGEPHFGMRGTITVGPPGGSEPPSADAPSYDRPLDAYWLLPPPEDASRVERGRWLYRQKGCFNCHGTNGAGGVANFNYIDDAVPALDTAAEKMFLFFPEEIDAIIEPLERGVPLASLEDDPPTRRFAATLAQYESIRGVIKNGNPPGKKDPDGPEPPLRMPAWAHHLSDDDIDAIIAYSLALTLEKEDVVSAGAP